MPPLVVVVMLIRMQLARLPYWDKTIPLSVLGLTQAETV